MQKTPNYKKTFTKRTKKRKPSHHKSKNRNTHTKKRHTCTRASSRTHRLRASSRTRGLHARTHPHHALVLQGGTQLVQINSNDEFRNMKFAFANTFFNDPESLYTNNELSPVNWRFGPLVTTRCTPHTRDELNRSLYRMFPSAKTTRTPSISRSVLENLGPLATWDTRLIDDMSLLGNQMHNDMDNTWVYDISNWDMSNVRTMFAMFVNCIHIRYINASRWDTRKVQNTNLMFMGCELLETIQFNNHDFQHLTTNFKRARISTPFQPFDVTNVKTMASMFNGCYNLQTLDLSTWNTSNVQDTSSMFADCVRLQTVQFENPQHTRSRSRPSDQSDNMTTKHHSFLNNDVNTRSMFWNVPQNAQINILGFTPWQWYLSNLNPISGSGIAPIQIPSPLMPPLQLAHLQSMYRSTHKPPQDSINDHIRDLVKYLEQMERIEQLETIKHAEQHAEELSWFGPFTLSVFQWQHITPAEICKMLFQDSQWSDLKRRQLEAVVDYLGNQTIPSCECTIGCTTSTQKQWRNLTTQQTDDNHTKFRVGATRTPYQQKCIETAKAHDEYRFQHFIHNTPVHTTQPDDPSPSVLVMAQLHGGYENCDIAAFPPIPMFTSPPGKGLIIVSVATPGAIMFNDHKDLEAHLVSVFRSKLQTSDFRDIMNRDPIVVAKQILQRCALKKTIAKRYIMTTCANPDDQYAQSLEYKSNSHFVNAFEQPRILYFINGDNCADKTFSMDVGRKLVTIRENTSNDTDRNLVPPNTNQITLSQLCYQMFVVAGHSTVILVDFSCSPFCLANGADVADPDRDDLATNFFMQMLGGSAN